MMRTRRTWSMNAGVTLLAATLCGLIGTSRAQAWTDPYYSNTVVQLEFDAAGNPVDDTSLLGVSDGVLGAGAAQPTWIGASNGVSAHYYFDGGDTITISNNASLAAERRNMTWSGWIYSTADTAVDYIYAKRPTSGSYQQWYASQAVNGSLTFRVSNATNALSVTSSLRLKANAWYFFAFAYNGSNRVTHLFINNRLDKRTASGVPVSCVATGQHLLVGNYSTTRWDGKLDTFAIHSNTLTTNDCYQLFWNTATNHGWSAYDYAFRSQWSNSLYVGTFTYDSPADSSFVSTNHGTKGAATAAPTFVSDQFNGWYSFDGGDTITLTVPGTKAAYTWWARTNGVWHHYAQLGTTQHVDAVAQSFSNAFFWTTNNTVTLGKNSTTYMSGDMDDFRVYQALTPSGLTSLYNGTKDTYLERGSRVEF